MLRISSRRDDHVSSRFGDGSLKNDAAQSIEVAPGSKQGFGIYILHLISVGLFFGGGFVITLLWPIARVIFGSARCAKSGPLVLQRLFRKYIGILSWLGLFRVRWSGLESIQNLRGSIIVANHPGLLDVVFLAAYVPRAICVMRASLMRIPAFSGAAKLAGYIPNDQGAEMIRACIRKLETGDNLLIFPEGTRTRHHLGSLNSFKAGFALTAKQSGAMVQTILIHQSQPYLTQEMSVVAWERAPVHLEIRPGAEFHVLPDESAREFSNRVESWFRDALQVGADQHPDEAQ